MKISDFIENLGHSAKSLVKIALLSRPVGTMRRTGNGDTLIILGNGPSLNDTLAEDADVLPRYSRLAVNFAANAPQFAELRPDYYVLADPHFFKMRGRDVNVDKLMANLEAVDWPMTLFVPANVKKSVVSFSNRNLTVKRYNAVGAEGFRWFTRLAFNCRLAMPRPRNVMIPSIMVGIWMGYKNIYLTGADHSWLKTLSVNEDNDVVSIQPHFYKEDKRESVRAVSQFKGVKLHELLQSFCIAFRSYFGVADFAACRGVNVYNSTPGSFIDAFPRRPLPRD